MVAVTAKKKKKAAARQKVRAKKIHYVDNVLFLDQMLDFQKEVAEAEEAGHERPKIPDGIGENFMAIAKHLSFKPNFINYQYRDDMISDGVENCLQYIDNFDPDKSRNPFAYFTQIIYYAFLRRISKEKKQLYIKYAAMEQSGLLHELVHQGENDDRSNITFSSRMYENQAEFMEQFEAGLKKTKDKATAKKLQGLEQLIEEGRKE